jgi:glycosyltransferase involved in cell wall biosynthesis
MMISAIINTRNEEKNIIRCLRSVSPYVDEIVVVDMESTDATESLAKKYTDRIFHHRNTDYVEPARNFAIEKAGGKWILLIDADEIIEEKVGLQLRQLADKQEITYYRIPRKNFIFGKWIKYSGWWPDYQIRFFQKGAVTWSDEIHSIPITEGKGADFPAEESQAFVHYHYSNVEQYIERLNRYTSQEARQRIRVETQFNWKQLITKPVGEFLTRFFVWEGYKDGIHGLALSLLQAFSFLIVELKVWQHFQFVNQENDDFLDESMVLIKKANNEIVYWYNTKRNEQMGGLAKKMKELRSRIRL